MIYFAELVSARIVKVGYTKRCPERRMYELAGACGLCEPLKLLGTMGGHFQAEKKIHWLLADYQINGEWFRLTEEIRRFIETCVAINDIDMAQSIHTGKIAGDRFSEVYANEWQSYTERGFTPA